MIRFSIDIWAAGIPETIISSGFEMLYNPAQVTYGKSFKAADGEDITVPGMERLPLRYPMLVDRVHISGLVQLGYARHPMTTVMLSSRG